MKMYFVAWMVSYLETVFILFYILSLVHDLHAHLVYILGKLIYQLILNCRDGVMLSVPSLSAFTVCFGACAMFYFSKPFLNENRCMYKWNLQRFNQTRWEWHHNTFTPSLHLVPFCQLPCVFKLLLKWVVKSSQVGSDVQWEWVMLWVAAT